jgi:hypothetical protein
MQRTALCARPVLRVLCARSVLRVRSNKFPAGDAELPKQTDMLNTVVFKR